MLEIKNLHVSYGAINAVQGINIHLAKGELVSLIGANGAGKSTTLKTIIGLLKPTQGEIFFQGEPINQIPAYQLISRGLALVPEGRGIFPHLTVEENLKMGAYHRKDTQGIRRDLDHKYVLFKRLLERKAQLAGTLSGGEQQMLAIARALMGRPSLLLLDEPSMGLAPLLVQKIFGVVKQIATDGVTILLVEQNARAALRLSQRAYVMEHGTITLTDTSDKLLSNPLVQSAYLGS